ncbi:endonuclease/exonuclease/phosphatase family metal-dependent hydrolase [Chitinophaga skermanii]|uniref:Endonuclease/exonuclease/phosphatase family metal-dependent hydrolase n=1 Tax=Chitinophaga skermanii TaxID=331697 RepID=A0A327Q6D6_9BACT|nr:endonuclease/exonuclease/phosphatase family protein [Chitinophaga skermanii]RAI98762.1 endonuclease/exonuclease/phosphatase family metal-dependent hydrolase [Chitinophaga skermanii]
MKSFATITRRLLLWGNIAVVLGLLASAFLPFVNPTFFWPAGFSGFAFPFFWIAAVLFIPIWLFIYRNKKYFISLVGILVTAQAFFQTVAFHPFSKAPVEKDPHTIKVASFNCSSLGLKDYQDNPIIRTRVYEALHDIDADVLCLQEFYTNDDPERLHNLDSIMQRCGYTYAYQTKDLTRWNTWHFGLAVLSKYPIIDTARIDFNSGPETENLLKANIVVANDTITIFNTHLKSYQFNARDYSVVKKQNVHGSRGLASKMKATFAIRAGQAEIVSNAIREAEHPVIVFGDFNAIPLAYSYKTIRQHLQDAFLEKGTGWGRTFSRLSPFLRIDYILVDPSMQVQSFDIFQRKGFEHYPIYSTISLKK